MPRDSPRGFFASWDGQVAHTVERLVEGQRVGGSIPPLSTTNYSEFAVSHAERYPCVLSQPYNVLALSCRPAGSKRRVQCQIVPWIHWKALWPVSCSALLVASNILRTRFLGRGTLLTLQSDLPSSLCEFRWDLNLDLQHRCGKFAYSAHQGFACDVNGNVL